MRKVLNDQFYNQDTRVVARALLGKYLVRRQAGKEIAHMITEVEAYDGQSDLASHAKGGPTKRSSIMFGPSGFWYVYLVYGLHYMLNIVTRGKGYPAAILIRGLDDLSGPGKITKYLNINQHLNKQKANRKSGLWIEDRGKIVLAKNISRLPRIGIDYAPTVWRDKPWRFKIK